MTSKSKFRISPGTAIACLALFLALTGSAFAVGKNTVRSAQIVNGTVRTVDLAKDAVKSGKIADATVTAADLGTDSVGSEEIADDAVTADEVAENAVASTEVAPDSLTAADLAASSVGASEVADQSLTQNDLGPGSVGSSELQTGAVRASELGTIIQVSNSTGIKAGGNATATVTCPAGTTVISGGGSGGFYQVHLTSTFRSGNGWRIDARNNAGADTTITAYAYCLTGGSSN